MGKAVKPKWYAIKRPNGEWVSDAVSDTIEQAWEYAFDVENGLLTHPHLTRAEVGEGEGYTCVEVELAEPGTTEALKMAREDFAIVDNFDQQKFTEGTAAAMAHHAAWMRLQEVLGRVTDNAKGEK